MSEQTVADGDSDAAEALAVLRKRKMEATGHLLGDTIAISEQAWQEPSRLPGWTRAHVAAHLARNADALARSVDAVLGGRRGLMYDSREDRIRAIERGSERSPLELQIDLDTSAGRLNDKLNLITALPQQLMVEVHPGAVFSVWSLPVMRLNEVILHHIDLDCGFEVDDVASDIAGWLLAWNARHGRVIKSLPPVQLESTSGFTATFGEATTVVRGSDAQLLGWLTGRLRPDTALRLGLPEQPAIC